MVKSKRTKPRRKKKPLPAIGEDEDGEMSDLDYSMLDDPRIHSEYSSTACRSSFAGVSQRGSLV